MAIITMKELQVLADKYGIVKSGTKTSIANTLCSIRGMYLSNKERKQILPLCPNNKNKQILKMLVEQNIRKRMPKK